MIDGNAVLLADELVADPIRPLCWRFILAMPAESISIFAMKSEALFDDEFIKTGVSAATCTAVSARTVTLTQ